MYLLVRLPIGPIGGYRCGKRLQRVLNFRLSETKTSADAGRGGQLTTGPAEQGQGSVAVLLGTKQMLGALEHVTAKFIGLPLRQMKGHQGCPTHRHGGSIGVFIGHGILGFDAKAFHFRFIPHYLGEDECRPFGQPQEETKQENNRQYPSVGPATLGKWRGRSPTIY